MHDINLAVRFLAEFLLRGGSIDARFSGLDRGGEGARIHRRLQKQAGKGYKAEVSLSIDVAQGDFCYHLSGRADGVITRADGSLMVDEIKTVTCPLAGLTEESNPAFWAQGCCYAHILCVQRGLAACAVRLTYYNVDTDEILRFEQEFTAEELADRLQGLLAAYVRWARLSVEWQAGRNASLRGLRFPFDDYRAGQRKMAVAAYRTYQEGRRLFCCAPTGIGKTLSAMFPALKAMGEGYGERAFYLTAKTVTRKAAEEALDLLRKRDDLCFNSLTLTAKDKICFLEERICLPEACPYAEGYYDRVNDAVYQLLGRPGGSTFGREAIEEAARHYRLCPYELSLDLASWSDLVIGDYNYLFDPVVHLQRFFSGEGGDYLFMVDEAHNLVERSREMFSARLRKSDFFAFKKELPKSHKRLHKALGNLNTAFIGLRRLCEEEDAYTLERPVYPAELDKPLEGFVNAAEAFLEDHRGTAHEDALLALYFEVLFYQKIAQAYDDTYTTLLHRYQSDVTVKLLCLDPSAQLDEAMAKGRGAVLFSATLQPLPYYRDTLGGGESARVLNLESPFDPANLGLFVADGVSTKYADREASLLPIAQLLAGMVAGRAGNYIAYFPSYTYLRQVLGAFETEYPGIPVLVQQSGMAEEERDAFLARFSACQGETLLGFCVLGGIFGEGVDLPGDALIGTAIVGVGLPQLGPEPDAIRRYYDEKNGSGFEFAYQFPGMNKVLQAAGRVIRGEGDRGVVLLIDSRFSTWRYQELFPAHWRHWQRMTPDTQAAQLAAFWQQGGKQVY